MISGGQLNRTGIVDDPAPVEPIVITEAEYYAGYTMGDNAGVVFVLPDAARVDTAKPLLEAAKLLMACTPNGI